MMTTTENLVPVIEHEIDGELQPCVDARTLHSWLGNGDRFATWIKKRINTYGFEKNIDYVLISVNTETKKESFIASVNTEAKKRRGGHNRTDYLLTLDMAKELSMVESNAQGKMARRYFINCEKTLRQTAFSLMSQFNKASIEFDKFTEIASNAGRTLNLVGKQYKPQALERLEGLRQKIQPMLPLES